MLINKCKKSLAFQRSRLMGFFFTNHIIRKEMTIHKPHLVPSIASTWDQDTLSPSLFHPMNDCVEIRPMTMIQKPIISA